MFNSQTPTFMQSENCGFAVIGEICAQCECFALIYQFFNTRRGKISQKVHTAFEIKIFCVEFMRAKQALTKQIKFAIAL